MTDLDHRVSAEMDPAARAWMTLTQGSPYQAYLYSYPHKSAYRPLSSARELRDVWRDEVQSALFLYLHIPFCEMRCGFCNLFTVVGTQATAMVAYTQALKRHAEVARAHLDRPRFARLAIGGGTPTLLDSASLHAVLDVAEYTLGADLAAIPISVETSPETALPERLQALVTRGVDRISIGVQSFVDDEVRAIGRAQDTDVVRRALARIRESGVRALNIDLMYGLPGQTEASWLDSLTQALSFAPEELFLYPLYVRPLTGMDRSSKVRSRRARADERQTWDAQRLALYRVGRDHLLARGYRQYSMRMFRRAEQDEPSGPRYRCQEDGMLGLGAGARSYTDTVHYSTEYAVGSPTVKSIIQTYVERDARAHGTVGYGIALDREERQRRHVILSLLHRDGLDVADYRRRFASDPMADVPQLAQLGELGWTRVQELPSRRISLTPAGVERSDAIGPWLHSERVRRLMAGYELR